MSLFSYSFDVLKFKQRMNNDKSAAFCHIHCLRNFLKSDSVFTICNQFQDGQRAFNSSVHISKIPFKL